jgi:glycosyltransferase involved in cell wall biosynthesis
MGAGGADRVTATLLQHFNRQRFAPTLVLLRAEGPLMHAVPSDVPVQALGSANVLSAVIPLAAYFRRQRPDIVLSTSSGTNVTVLLAAALSSHGPRLVISERNVLLHARATARRRLILLLKRLTYSRADAVTAVSQCVRDDLVARLHLRPDRVRVVYSPVSLDEVAALARAPASHPWLKQDLPVVLSAGRLVPAKDHHLLLRAFHSVRTRRAARLIILGEGPLRQALLAEARRLGMGDVALPGFDPNPFAYMARCSVFVLSSRFEGLPGVLMQAMACGSAVISTDCPCGPAEIIEPGVSGLLTPVGDSGALADAISGLLDDPPERERLGEAARRAAQRFSTERIVPLYEAALTGGPGA